MATLVEVANLSKRRQEIVEVIRLKKEKEIGKLFCDACIDYPMVKNFSGIKLGEFGESLTIRQGFLHQCSCFCNI